MSGPDVSDDATVGEGVTAAQAYRDGRAAAENPVPMHDLGGHLDRMGVPTAVRGSWISGLEDGLAEQGFDVEGCEGDGFDWERRALAGLE